MIIGAGGVGHYLASRLSIENQDVVVIDRDPESMRRLESLDVQTILGTGSSPEVLEEAGVRSAAMVVAVTDSDEVNMIACLFANALNPAATKIARIRDKAMTHFPHVLEKDFLDLSLVINPEQEVAKTVLRLLEVPGASDVVDLADGLIKLIGVRVAARAPLAGKKLADLADLPQAEHFLIAAISRGEKLIIPRGPDMILPADLVYLIVEPSVLAEVMELLGNGFSPLHRVTVVGGGSLGYTLASALDEMPVQTRIIERDPERCRFLAENLNKVIVLQGDGTDRDLLEEEHIADTDAFVVLTNDEEENILMALLGQQMGVRLTITRISKLSYLPLVSAIGLERVVSPRISAANAILQYIRRGKIISVTQIQGEEAEAIEFVALETSEIVHRPLNQLNLPAGTIIGAIVRQEKMIVPKGETVVLPGDRVVILSRREAVSKVEKALTVKLSHF